MLHGYIYKSLLTLKLFFKSMVRGADQDNMTVLSGCTISFKGSTGAEKGPVLLVTVTGIPRMLSLLNLVRTSNLHVVLKGRYVNV